LASWLRDAGVVLALVDAVWSCSDRSSPPARMISAHNASAATTAFLGLLAAGR
jgi:hypothetical protein